eukprot:328850-Hanusia_phi.AAC.1
MLTTTPHALACYFGALMKLHSMDASMDAAGSPPSLIPEALPPSSTPEAPPAIVPPEALPRNAQNFKSKERVAILGAGVGGSAVPLSVLFDEVECV